MALAGMLGVTGVGALRSAQPAPPPAPHYDDPVKQAVAATMVELFVDLPPWGSHVLAVDPVG